MPLTGANKHKRRLQRLQSRNAIKGINRALFAGGELIANHAAKSITNGAVSGRGHVPSLPGDPPNADTHVLDRSIRTDVIRDGLVEVSANAPYAGVHEFGDRPFMRPAVNAKRDEVVTLVGKAVDIIVKQSGA